MRASLPTELDQNKRRITIWMIVVLVIVTLSVFISIEAWHVKERVFDSGIDGLQKPTALSRYRGTTSSPNGKRVVHIFTHDPGATGNAYLWLYEKTDSISEKYSLIFEGDIPHDDWLEIEWGGSDIIIVEHEDEFGNLIKDEIVLESP